MSDYIQVMLTSPANVKSYGEININFDETKLGAAIRTSQNVYLVDAIGKDLVAHLQILVFNKISGEDPDTIDAEANVAYKTLLDEYVKPFLAYRSAVEVCISNSLKVRNLGVIKNADTNANPVDTNDYIRLRQYYETFAVDCLNKMMDFLCENKTAFMELGKDFCTCSRKPMFARTGLFLG